MHTMPYHRGARRMRCELRVWPCPAPARGGSWSATPCLALQQAWRYATDTYDVHARALMALPYDQRGASLRAAASGARREAYHHAVTGAVMHDRNRKPKRLCGSFRFEGDCEGEKRGRKLCPVEPLVWSRFSMLLRPTRASTAMSSQPLLSRRPVEQRLINLRRAKVAFP
jgi:hypothetical protein